MSTLLLVTGAGRSGTSTAAGALSMLGAHVPGPYLEANASNPKGFYESQWSVDFHNTILKRVPMGLTDARPEAQQLFTEAIRDSDRTALRDWLAEQTRDQTLTVIKDPRTLWSIPLVEEVAGELGLRLALMVMLRPPQEVVASRGTYYSKYTPGLAETEDRVRNLAGWTNTVTVCEQHSRALPRTFVQYHDLLDDWRTTLGKAFAELEVDLPIPEDPHAVDTFIDPGLNRHQSEERLPAVLEDLRALSERIWHAFLQLADPHGSHEPAETEIDNARSDYARLYIIGNALTYDTVAASEEAGRQAVARVRATPPVVPPAPVPASAPVPERAPRPLYRRVGGYLWRRGRRVYRRLRAG